ncbi:hypothetical protein BU14_0255s0026 [Porphyra umbilicalis]|uniref:PBS-linker domain-containing protein n=1 Tax=Porphyra umbilicalis TaxID=2786 RepID=A0A1X6P2M1_PORUM|nr:hypothetical protein BU14_0255s0026 [Porphyra umbilicalis]|eukprot:OSX75119.1 hypothetical protein BU14_0255s0026 [Porphyra umbilicalis]
MAAFIPAGGVSPAALSTARRSAVCGEAVATPTSAGARPRARTTPVALNRLPKLPSFPGGGKKNAPSPPAKATAAAKQATAKANNVAVKVGGKQAPAGRPAEVSVGGTPVKRAPKGAQKGIPINVKFYNPASARYHFARAAAGQSSTPYDVRVSTVGFKKHANERVNDQGTFRNMNPYTWDTVWTHGDMDSDEKAIAVRAVYKNVLGNAHLMESERAELAYSESCFTYTGNAKEFVRAVAQSDAYRTRYFEPVTPMRFVELTYKNILGRAPRSQAEYAGTMAVLQQEGYKAAINSLVDSAEYDSLFGETRVPAVNFRGGHETNNEMNRLAVLSGSASSSDKSKSTAAVFPAIDEASGVTAATVEAGLPDAWKGENAARENAGLARSLPRDAFWSGAPMQAESKEWTAKYGKWFPNYYADSVVYRDVMKPRISVSEEEAEEAAAVLKYGSLMAKSYTGGARKVWDKAPMVELKTPKNGQGGYVRVSLETVTGSIPSNLSQKV